MCALVEKLQVRGRRLFVCVRASKLASWPKERGEKMAKVGQMREEFFSSPTYCFSSRPGNPILGNNTCQCFKQKKPPQQNQSTARTIKLSNSSKLLISVLSHNSIQQQDTSLPIRARCPLSWVLYSGQTLFRSPKVE